MKEKLSICQPTMRKGTEKMRCGKSRNSLTLYTNNFNLRTLVNLTVETENTNKVIKDAEKKIIVSKQLCEKR